MNRLKTADVRNPNLQKDDQTCLTFWPAESLKTATEEKPEVGLKVLWICVSIETSSGPSWDSSVCVCVCVCVTLSSGSQNQRRSISSPGSLPLRSAPGGTWWAGGPWGAPDPPPTPETQMETKVKGQCLEERLSSAELSMCRDVQMSSSCVHVNVLTKAGGPGSR